MTCKEFRKKSWDDLNSKWSTTALITLIVVAINAIVFSLPYLGIVVEALILGPLNLGLALVYLNVVRNEKVTIESMFSGFKRFLDGFVLFLIQGLLIFLWSLLLIVPGIIKSLEYSMSYFILQEDTSLSANEARVKSMKMMKGHRWDLFVLNLSFIGWWILTGLTFGILAFWTVPYYNAIMANFYEYVKDIPSFSQD